jgi:hypothetical protein
MIICLQTRRILQLKIYDKDIRMLLLSKIAKTKEFVADPACIVVNEMDVCFGCARIDIAVINDKIHGYEIKSERDNLERLPDQADLYNRVFDALTLVFSEKHYDKAVQILPEWWGLYCVTKGKTGISLGIMRNPKQNPQVEAINVAQLLWKNELHELLRLNGISKGIKNKTRYELSKLAEQEIEHTEISDFVSRKLKTRESWKSVFLKDLPNGRRE